MRRRDFLALGCTTAVASLAGCASVTDQANTGDTTAVELASNVEPTSPRATAKAVGQYADAAAILSTSRFGRTEGSDLAIQLLEDAGHHVSETKVVTDSAAIRAQLEAWVNDTTVDVIVTVGGTGIRADDNVPEILVGLFEREMPAFSRIFHQLSYEMVGVETLDSNPVAGVANNTVIFAVPGWPHAVATALEHIVIPDLQRLLFQLRLDTGRAT